MSAWEGGYGISATDVSAALGLPTPTPAQQRVIEAAASPALVVAGAGSGKTETMSGRVVWLVANGLVRRDEILGLTFTRKAAGELAERIIARLDMIDEYGRRGLLPHLHEIVADGSLARIDAATSDRQRDAIRTQVLDGLASRFDTGWDPSTPHTAQDLMIRPRVSTYNAFADSIVREHAARIGRDPEAAMLSQSASWLIACAVVLRADIPGIEDVDRALSTVIDAVQRLASEVLDHRVDIDEVEKVALAYAESFAPYRSRSTVEPVVANLLSMPVLAALVREYVAEKQRRSVLDFADQVGGAFDIIEGSPEVRAELREQHRIVLLDEYQDTSVIQTRFLAALFRDSAVMAVGDPHQSIYGWRGASADNLYAFGRTFATEQTSTTYSLMTSWRNDRRILMAANRVLEPLKRPGLEVPELEARPGAGDGRVDMRFCFTVDDEADEVAEWFLQRRAEHETSRASDTALHTGAILFRSKRHMQTFAAALARREIPHRILGLGGLLSTPEVVDVISMLRVVHDPTSGSALIRLLVGPRFGVGVADMAALYELASTLAQRDAALAPLPEEVRLRLRASRGADEAVSIVDAVDFVRVVSDDYRMLEKITPEGRARLRAAGESLERLRRAAGQPITEVIRLIELELRLDIELAVNESRGPARLAATQLRAFSDEVRTFLAADDRGTIGSLLAWLDKAESSDELMPRPEPAEPGVVQLLTIHGSKGLEWDAVAVVRLVKDELPSRVSDASGWFGFGVVPFALRGDRDALPTFRWDPKLAMAGAGDDEKKRHKAAEDALASGRTKAHPNGGALHAFKDEYRDYQQQEERRLAYVAITRARRDLLLTGAHWAGQTTPRAPSAYLLESIEVLGLGEIGEVDESENPYEGAGLTTAWPLDPLGSRRVRVEAAAAEVQQAFERDRPAPTTQLERLLAERAERQRGVRVQPPTRVPASKFKDYVTDFEGTVLSLARPMPERPYRQTRLGTLFHAWVEHRSGLVGAGPSADSALWDSDDEQPDPWSVSPADEADLERLREIFEGSEWAALKPIAVEIEINFALGSAVPSAAEVQPAEGQAAEAHIVICKLDAVYRREDRGGRIEIVDWKTGRAPRNSSEKDERMLQLALYRLAYHRRFDVPLEDIDVALYYVADDLVIRGDRVYSEEELVQRWSAARAAR